MIASPSRLPMLQAPQWADLPDLVHGFCGRYGGTSEGVFAELNLSRRVGDQRDAVSENWRRVTSAVGATMRFATTKQVHGTRVVTVGHESASLEEADALVTCEAGIALGVLTADCVPILLVAPQRHVVAAVHAGWRGTVGGIAARTVQYLQSRFAVDPADIRAALGPAIGNCCYEVDGGIVDQLEAYWGAMPAAVERVSGATGRPAKAMLDLRRANAAILARAGIREADITSTGPCTRCAATDYFSYRAAIGATGSGVTGRQLSFIGWHD